MRIPCAFCGERDLREFVYWGEGGYHRPDPQSPFALQAFVEAVYSRDNPAGIHQEFWYHVLGCRSWLRVTRDTRTHEIQAVEFANPTLAAEYLRT